MDYINKIASHSVILQQLLYSQFKYNAHDLPIVIGVIQLDETRMLQ